MFTLIHKGPQKRCVRPSVPRSITLPDGGGRNTTDKEQFTISPNCEGGDADADAAEGAAEGVCYLERRFEVSGSNYGKQQLVLASAHVWTDSVASDNHCPEGGAEEDILDLDA